MNRPALALWVIALLTRQTLPLGYLNRMGRANTSVLTETGRQRWLRNIVGANRIIALLSSNSPKERTAATMSFAPAALALLFVLFLAPAPAPAQIVRDTTPNAPLRLANDSLPPATIADTIASLEEIQRGPRQALLWSIVPGGGQVYNKRWWKVPLVYGGLLGMVAYADFNQTRYVRFRTELELRCLGEGNVVVIPNAECIPNDEVRALSAVSTQALVQARDNADRARQTAYIGIFVVYLMQGIEAFTDAHLQRFDISDDLTLRLGPVTQPEGQFAYGLTVPLGTGRRLRREEKRTELLRWRAR